MFTQHNTDSSHISFYVGIIAFLVAYAAEAYYAIYCLIALFQDFSDSYLWMSVAALLIFGTNPIDLLYDLYSYSKVEHDSEFVFKRIGKIIFGLGMTIFLGVRLYAYGDDGDYLRLMGLITFYGQIVLLTINGIVEYYITSTQED